MTITGTLEPHYVSWCARAMTKRFRNAAGDLAEHVLMALALLGGVGTPTDVTKTIRAELGRPASEARIYQVLGSLVEEGEIYLSKELAYDGRRNRKLTVLRLRRRRPNAEDASDE